MPSRVKPIPSVTRLDKRRPFCTQGTALAVLICREQSLGDVSNYSGMTDNVALGVSQPPSKQSIPLDWIFL